MEIKGYVKKYNLPFDKVKSEFNTDFNSLYESEKEWLENLENKIHLLKNEKNEKAVKQVIQKLKEDNFFQENDTLILATFLSKINTIVRIANRINNFKEGTNLDNGTKLKLYDFFNSVKASNNLTDFNYPLNSNLANFLPHIYSVIKHCQNPTEYPIYYKYWKNILREVLSKEDDYDSMCKFYRSFPSSNRHLNFATYLGTIGIQIAKNIDSSGIQITKDSKEYKYLTTNVINIERYNSILDEKLSFNQSLIMEDYKVINEFISKVNSNEINAANSIKKLIIKDNFKNNLRIIDELFFEQKLKDINQANYNEIIDYIKSIHKINSGEYNDFNIWSASKSFLNQTNTEFIQRHDELNKEVGFPDNGNGLYKSFLGKTNFLKYISNKFKQPSVIERLELRELETLHFKTQDFVLATKDSGLIYDLKLISRYISSLITKPFVLLSGLSGSGKTKLAQSFAQWICEDETQFCIVPVGADWTNREPLLGYVNALNPNEYILPENGALQLIIEANKEENQNKPYFLILDEMNLSHVERYFADFLSVMESKDKFKLHTDKEKEKSEVPFELGWPKNLFVVGTVNIDETTYMFSPKVLDRANAIEFRVTKEEIGNFLSSPNQIDLTQLESKGANMAADFIEIAKNKEIEEVNTDDLNDTLVNFFGQLQKTGAEFGYRTGMEIHRLYQQLTVINKDITEKDKIDIAIMQKLLPKLHGSRRKLCPILETLGKLCVVENIDVKKDFLENKEQLVFNDTSTVKYPLSLEKITRMYKGAIENGFASYAEA